MLVVSTGVFLLLLSGVLSIRQDIIGRRPGPRDNYPRSGVASHGKAGLCRFGQSRFGCCYGWKRDNFGGCIPVCEEPCVHGRCAGPNRCHCERGYTGNTCERDLNECSARPCSHRCMNTPGSYRCYCEHGYVLLEDGMSCSRDDRCSATRCSFGCIQFEDGFTCFCPDGLALLPDGLGCKDIDECETGTAECPVGRRCKNTYGNYMCLCPVGYKFAYVDGVLDCIDENECDTNKCDTNAYCINVVGGFDCKCNEGFVGDGFKCVAVDSTTCLDGPCFPGVACTTVPVSADVSIEGVTSVKQYRCGECPPTFIGDGETCTSSTIPIQIITMEEGSPIGGVTVKALQDRDDGQTEVVAEGQTDLNGIANLQVPSGFSLQVVATKMEYIDAVKSYNVKSEGGNVVTFAMEQFPEHTSFLYRQATSKAFEFGNVNGERAGFRLGFPEGALRAGDRAQINIEYKGVDVSSTSGLSAVPDLTKVEGEPAGQRLIPLGAAELTILDNRGQKLVFKKPASMTFVLKDYIDLLGVRKSLDAYYFDTAKGKWVKDGTGTITETNDGPTWTYETTHFTWWIVAIAFSPDRSLTVRTCFDAACTRPAAHIPIVISGVNFYFYEEHETGVSGSICTDIFTAELNQVNVVQSCTGESQIAIALSETSTCSEDGGQVVTFVVPESLASSACPNPGEPENGLRFGEDFSLGGEVTFHCDSEYRIEGSSQRVCLHCNKWSGTQPTCEDFVYSGSSSIDN